MSDYQQPTQSLQSSIMDELASPEEAQSRIASEQSSYHSIAIYNMVRDRLWMQQDFISRAQTPEQIKEYVTNMRNLLLRGDSLWMEIKKAVEEKKKGFKTDKKEFPYNNELIQYADKLEFLQSLIEHGRAMVSDPNEETRELAYSYIRMQTYQKLTYLRKYVEAVVREADKLWGEKAALIGFTMPIEVKEQRDPFLF